MTKKGLEELYETGEARWVEVERLRATLFAEVDNE